MDSTHRVIEVKWWAPEIFELVVERNGMEFVPGDCITAYTADRTESRPYSLASGIDEDRLSLLIRKMTGGILSTYLAARQPGDVVQFSEPFGWFRPGQSSEAGQPSVFIATGTGIAPFLSYLRSHIQPPPPRCLYGVRRYQDAVLVDLLQTRCQLDLAVSRETANGHHHGRVTDLLDNLPIDSTTHFYLCGLDSMIDETTDWLEDHDVDYMNIHREVFFYASP